MHYISPLALEFFKKTALKKQFSFFSIRFKSDMDVIVTISCIMVNLCFLINSSFQYAVVSGLVAFVILLLTILFYTGKVSFLGCKL